MLAQKSKACSELISFGCKRACLRANVLKQTFVALHCVLVLEVFTKTRMTLKSVSF